MLRQLVSAEAVEGDENHATPHPALSSGCGERVAGGRVRDATRPRTRAGNQNDQRPRPPDHFFRLASTFCLYSFAFAIVAGTSTVSTLPLRMRIFPSQMVVTTELPEEA